MLHLGGAWDQKAVDAGSLAMDSREISARGRRPIPVARKQFGVLAQKSAGAEIPAGSSDCKRRSLVQGSAIAAESSPISTVSDGSPVCFGKESSRGSEVSYGIPDSRNFDSGRGGADCTAQARDHSDHHARGIAVPRSEERRVGKECRSRWS